MPASPSKADAKRGMVILAKVGLIAFGVVHLLIAVLAFQIAFGSKDNTADKSGAMKELADKPFGTAMLWILAIGLVALAAWQVSDAVHGGTKPKELWRRASNGARAVVYGSFAFTAFKVATGDGASSSGSEKKAASGVLGLPGGKYLVMLAGIVIIVVAVRLIIRGIKKKFLKDIEVAQLPTGTRTWTERIGMVGYIGKGAAYTVVGVLVVIAGITSDPDKAGGLDVALKTLAGETYGVVLLVAIAAGITCFGVYCFAWAKAPRLQQDD